MTKKKKLPQRPANQDRIFIMSFNGLGHYHTWQRFNQGENVTKLKSKYPGKRIILEPENYNLYAVSN